MMDPVSPRRFFPLCCLFFFSAALFSGFPVPVGGDPLTGLFFRRCFWVLCFVDPCALFSLSEKRSGYIFFFATVFSGRFIFPSPFSLRVGFFFSWNKAENLSQKFLIVFFYTGSRPFFLPGAMI